MITAKSAVSVEMCRLCLVGIIFTILFAGGVNSNNSITSVSVKEGGHHTVFVTTLEHDVTLCHLETPHDGIIQFKPGDETKTNAKFEIGKEIPGLTNCTLTIRNFDKNDEGLWVMSYDRGDDADAARIQIYNISVNAAESEENQENEEENVTLLSMIQHFTGKEMLIDISLDKKSFEEECYVLPPNGVLTKVDDFKMENVTVHKSGSYVSCRITLGPMSETLLGDWRLCGKSTDEMRCQPVNIAWNNNNNPDALWSSIVRPRFRHPVHIGGSVNPGVSGNGNVATCHVITPNGEDLVITSDVEYPHIKRIDINRSALCSINFINIDRSTIGDWTIYGKFRSSFGLNEVHLPLQFYFYDENNPYNQAYNVTVLPEDRHLVNLGTRLDVDVTSTGQVDNCQYRMPTGQLYDLTNTVTPTEVVLQSLDTATACRLTISPITTDLSGEWQLIGKFSNRNQFTERRQTFHVIIEDPANPIIEDFRIVENLTELFIDSQLGLSHSITITSAFFNENESCHLLTPNGLQYAFIDGFNIPNVEIVQGNGIECGVKVNVQTPDMLGQWTLIARASRSSIPIERRRSFTIRIEETLSLGNPVTITKGADLHLSLLNSTYMYDTCKLYGPNDEEITDFEVDPVRYSFCGYIVRNVSRAQSGTWAIVYGNQITYRATVDVKVLESVEIFVEDLVLTLDSAVNITVGPDDAVYCRLVDIDGKSVFDGFGPCRIVLDRVTMDHKGLWRISVGAPGTIMLHDSSIWVDVLADSKPVVTTSVTTNAPSLTLTCSVPVKNEVQTCNFRDPGGIVLVASHGVGQDGYASAIMNYESDTRDHDCSLRLFNPSSIFHSGIWRCGVHTAQGTSYGFLTVTGSMMNQSNDFYSTVPVLKSHYPLISSSPGHAVTMSCSIDAVLRYCYFRAQNGTVFNVGPSTTSRDFEYVGNGFDAGDCGIRFNSFWQSEASTWSCNVGLADILEEQSDSFNIKIKDRLWINHRWQDSSVVLKLEIEDMPELEYCRFVRIDGLSFTSDNVPSQYFLDLIDMRFGACTLTIPDPTCEDVRPWTVFAKVLGEGWEISMTSSSSLSLPSYMREMTLIGAILFWASFGFLCLLVILAAVSLIPKKNRKWTHERTVQFRNTNRENECENVFSIAKKKNVK